MLLAALTPVCVCSMQMFLSIGFAAAGVVGGLYSLIVAALGLANGPMCLWSNTNNPILEWGIPFANRYICTCFKYFVSYDIPLLNV